MTVHEADDDVIDLTAATRRLERDALGPRAIPAGARYGIHTLRAVEALGISRHRLGDQPDLVKALGEVKQAAARANGDAGALSAGPSRAIDRAAARLAANEPELNDDLIADLLSGGGSIAVHMNVNEVLANVANESLGRPLGAYDPITPKAHVGASQSTADVCHTASRLAILAGLERLDAILEQTIHSLADVVRRMDGTDTLARTCLQDAMVAPAGLIFDGTLAALTRRRASLARAAEPLSGVVLGGTVIGTGAGAPVLYRERVVPHLCEVTGRNLFLHPHRASALQHSDDLVAVAAELAGIAHVATKLAQDIRLLSSGPEGGFAEVIVPHVLEGSSFFGDKRNPVIAETMMVGAMQVIGHEAAVRAASSRAELHLQVFDNVAVVNVLDATAILATSLERFDQACLRGVTVDHQRAAHLAATVTPPADATRASTAPADPS
jgi:aspartate ammonia-lyase